MDGQARVGVACAAPERAGEAGRLAAALALPLTTQDDTRIDYLLALTPKHLELRSLGPEAPGPIFVDFVAGALAHRRRFGGGRAQPLARAIGLKPGYNPEVIEATAGMGRDAFVLAILGCRVRMIERSPVIAALLADGLGRATADPEVGPLLDGRLQLIQADSIAHLRALPPEHRPDVVYLDPMYPHRRKSALVKKEMRAFRALVGDDPDAGTLLAAALGAARRRVVVKRPKGAASLPGPPPSATVESPNTRYDLYSTGIAG